MAASLSGLWHNLMSHAAHHPPRAVSPILPDLTVPSRANQQWLVSGIDSLEHCRDKQHFQTYPHNVEYVYNSRGFRDQEWPVSDQELRDAIWCLGDSFTVGIGQPLTHIWPQILSTTTGRRCINISMDGASNDWICRRAQQICSEIQPAHMVIMWSYTHRRELPDTSLNDESRMIYASGVSQEQDLDHWTNLSNKIHTLNCDIVQCTIPEFHADIPMTRPTRLQELWHTIKGQDWPPCPCSMTELQNLPDWIRAELRQLHNCYSLMESLLMPPRIEILPDVIYIAERLDWARDHHHFDILTARWVVDQIVPRLGA